MASPPPIPPPHPTPRPAPPPAQRPAGPARAAVDQRILAALNVEVPPLENPPGYGLAMGLLAVFLVLIAAAFFSFLGFLLWLALWHLYNAVVSLQYGPYFLFHLPMAFLGGLLLVFLVKPLFLRKKEKDEQILTLTAADEPMLFAFVHKLCAATGAPVPTRIEVDCEPNAHARFRRGFLSFFQRDLVLRIGLPLAAALPVRQFAGVLAHEFGHFNQRSGMGGSYLIRRLTGFFAKIVFQRDRLDEKLANLRHSSNGWGKAFYWVALCLIEPARGVLWLMMLCGELLTCHVLRRMEFDADQFEAYVCGPADFAKTGRLLVFLSIASQRARYDLSQAWEQRRLADDLPGLIVANARQLAEYRIDILKHVHGEKTRWFDTHPCHNDRCASVERLGVPGVVQCDLPAKALFADFPALSKRATDAFYRSVLEKEFSEGKLVPTAEIVAQRESERKAFKVLRRFFRDHVVAGRPIFPGKDALLPPLPPGDPRPAVGALQASREQMLSLAQGLGAVIEQHEKAAATIAVARAQVALCGIFIANYRIARVRSKAQKEMRRHEPMQAASGERLEQFEAAARQRLTTALRLLQVDAVGARLGNLVAARQETLRMVSICQRLEAQVPAMTRLREVAMNIRVMFSAYNPQQPYPPLVRKIIEAATEAVGLLKSVKDDLAGKAYPFEHAQQGISMGDYLVHKIPEPDDPVEVYGEATAAFERFHAMGFRALGKLTVIAEQVETAVGMPALAEPPEHEEKEDQTQEKRNVRKYWIGYGLRAAAGLLLVGTLIQLSINPPTLPTFSADRSQAAYRPAGFRPSVSRFDSYHYTPPSYQPGMPSTPQPPTGMPQGPQFGGYTPQHHYVPPSYTPPSYTPPNYPGHQPGQPGYQPGQPGYQPGQPGYPGAQPPTYHQPPSYTPPSPPRYTPPSPPSYSPPSYSPPSPGGGGFGGGSGGGFGGGGRR